MEPTLPVLNQYCRELMCLAQGHNTVTHVGIEPRTSLFGVRRSTTTPRSLSFQSESHLTRYMFLQKVKRVLFVEKKPLKRYKKATIRKRRNQKKIPTPKTDEGKNKLTIRYQTKDSDKSELPLWCLYKKNIATGDYEEGRTRYG